MTKVHAKLSHGVPGITQRPRSIKSGRPLQNDLSIQYRSDLYMQEQYSRVAQLQGRLLNALFELSAPPTNDSVFTLERAVDELKRQCDETIVVLQVVKKIDSELYFAREGLKKAIEVEDSSLIHLRRKRVQWLESKLEDVVVRSTLPSSVSRAADSDDKTDSANEADTAKMAQVMSVSHQPVVVLPTRSAVASTSHSSSEATHLAGSADTHVKTVLLTEVSALTAASGAATSHVTIKSPDAIEDSLEDEQHRPRDSIDEYWSSEHHRFEFSALAPVMASLDPNTLHQVALAVPGTYVDRPTSERGPELPWRDQSDDIHDVHREAFDRLSVQIHQMYDKVYEAAMASVNRECAATGSTSRMRNTTSSSKKYGSPLATSLAPSTAAMTSAGPSRSGTQDQSRIPGTAPRQQLPPLQQDADVSSRHMPPLVYNPKPIPPPQQLPLTRVNRDRHYPQPIAAFASPFNGSGRERPERLVNQGSMYEDTRLVIYKPTSKPRTSTTAATSVGSALTSLPVTAAPDTRATFFSSRAGPQDASVTPAAAAAAKTAPLTVAAMLRQGVSPAATADADKRDRPVVRLSVTSLQESSSVQRSHASSGSDKPLLSASSAVSPEKRDRTPVAAVSANERKRRKTPTETQSTSAKDSAGGAASRGSVSLKKTFNLARVMTKLREGPAADDMEDGARGEDEQLKSSAVGHAGLKWERVKELIKVGLASPASEARADAAKQLGTLRCNDPSVIFSLKQQIAEDDDERVQYECAKALLSIGCLENEIVQIATDYLVVGNQEVRLDIIKCISNARNIQYISKRMAAFANLVKSLAHFCQSSDPEDPVAYEAAVCFGKLCVRNPLAVEKMKRYLVECEDTHKKALTLRILIKQFNEGGWALVEAVLEQLMSSPVWEYRVEAAQLLQHLGRRHVAATDEGAQLVYAILERRLWDDSQELVRLECAKTMALLDMYATASETAIRQLTDANETVRAHAVTSLGTLGVKTNKIVRHLLEMLDLDPSDMVRRQVIRAFGAMSLNDKRVIRALKERERAEGMLGSEAKRVLHKLEPQTATTSAIRASAAA